MNLLYYFIENVNSFFFFFWLIDLLSKVWVSSYSRFTNRTIYVYIFIKCEFTGPTWLPIIGNLRDIKKLCKIHGGQHVAFSKLAEQFKTNVLGLKLGNDHVVIISSYPLVRAILTSDVYEGRPDNFFMRTRCMGTRRGNECFVCISWKLSIL